jgi:HK97 gp10 family phage protein
VSADVQGVIELKKQLRAIERELPKTLRQVIRASANEIRNLARSRVPRGGPYTPERLAKGAKPGRGRASIRVTMHREGLSATVGSRLFYMRFYEFGTSRQPARPFLFPAAEQVTPKLRAGIAAAVNDAMLRAKARP